MLIIAELQIKIYLNSAKSMICMGNNRNKQTQKVLAIIPIFCLLAIIEIFQREIKINILKCKWTNKKLRHRHPMLRMHQGKVGRRVNGKNSLEVDPGVD